MTDTPDLTIEADKLHQEWESSHDGAALHGSALRTRVEEKICSNDKTQVEKVIARLVKKRAEVIAKRLGLELQESPRIGTGGFGYVYAATDSQWTWPGQPDDNKKRVALKLLDPLLVEPAGDLPSAQAADTSTGGATPSPVGMEQTIREEPRPTGITPMERFRKEHICLERLKHPGLPTLYRASEFKRQPYFVMEQGGPSLWDPKGYQQVVGDPARVARFSAALLEVLALIHADETAHRDLKPANILVQPGVDGMPRPMLIDLGIAQIRGQNAERTKTGQEPGGQDDFSEKEIADDRLARYQTDARPADIYNFGRVLEFLLDPRKFLPEVRADSPVRGGNTPPVTAYPSGNTTVVNQPSDRSVPQAEDPLRAQLFEIVAKCKKLPIEERYTTVVEVQAAVQKLLRPATASPAPPPAPLPPPVEPAPQATSLPAQLVRHWHVIAATLLVGILLGFLFSSGRKSASNAITTERDRLAVVVTNTTEPERLVRSRVHLTPVPRTASPA